MTIRVNNLELGKCYSRAGNSIARLAVYKMINDDMYGKRLLVYEISTNSFERSAVSFNVIVNALFTEVPDPTVKTVTLEIPENILNVKCSDYDDCEDCPFESILGIDCETMKNILKFLKEYIIKAPN